MVKIKDIAASMRRDEAEFYDVIRAANAKKVKVRRYVQIRVKGGAVKESVAKILIVAVFLDCTYFYALHFMKRHRMAKEGK